LAHTEADRILAATFRGEVHGRHSRFFLWIRIGSGFRTLARCGVGASHFSANSAWCVSSWASRSSFNRSKSRSATLRVFLSSRAQARGNEWIWPTGYQEGSEVYRGV